MTRRPPAPAVAASQPSPDPRAELAARIDPIFSGFAAPGARSPGCAVGVYRAGEIVYSKGYGYADLEHEDPITDATPFYSASLSKQFTAAAVLLLAADGKLALGDDVRRYVPELPDFGARVTVDQLLHHTSGLRDYHLLLLLEGLNEEDVITRREILWLLAHQRTLGFPPGSRFSYSSSGYVLAAEIVARVSGEPFGAFLARRVLEPLGMTGSLVREDHARLIPHRAIGYTRGPDGQSRSFMGNLEYDGSSNLVTTIRDLARWDANFTEPRVGGPGLVEAMRTRGRLADGTVLSYAMGLVEEESHGLAVELHDGGFAGYRSALYRYPSERTTVAVLCNTTEVDPDALAEQVAAAVIPKLAAPRPDVAPPPVPAATFGFEVAAVAGTYADLDTAQARVLDADGGVLRMRYARSTRAPRELALVGPGDLFVKGGHSHYRYEPPRGRQPARLVRTAPGEAAQTFVRVEPIERVDPVAALADYVGRFGNGELAHDLEIRVEQGHLVAAAVGGASRTAGFAPVARDLFATEEEGWRFERDARGSVVRLVASTDRARGVVLAKRALPAH